MKFPWVRRLRAPKVEGATEAAVQAWDTVLDTGEASGFGLAVAAVRTVLGSPKWLLAVALLLGLGAALADRLPLVDVPAVWQQGAVFTRAVDRGLDWAVRTWDPLFSAINVGVLQYLMLPLERWLLALPWWLATGAVVYVAARIVGRGFGAVTMVLMGVLVVSGLFDLAMSTLAIVLTATVLAVALGLPTGIAAAKSNRFDAVLRPVLDMMQTMPSFVYLIPVLMLFGLGKVPAVIATVIYAVPPVIRLTSLGIRQVDSAVVEAAQAFGATPLQLLTKVQLPLALPTIMAGLNQTIMMALAMVVIASMIGAKGLGVEVLNGIARLEVGRGLLGGIGIVIMAVILDRITQGLAKRRQPKRARAPRPSGPAIAAPPGRERVAVGS